MSRITNAEVGTFRRTVSLTLLALIVSACADADPTGMASTEDNTESRPFLHGAFLGDAESESHRIRSSIDAFTDRAQGEPALIKTFHRLDDDYGSTGWSGRTLREVDASGRVNFVALDLRWNSDSDANLLEGIAEGRADAVIRTTARTIREFGALVLVEPGWEMNGAWDYPWQPAANGGSLAPELYGAAWRRIVDIFREEQATNVRWVFSPNVGNPVAGHGAGASHWNWYGHYYPGPEYVDYLGLHGFNAPSLWDTPYLTFDELFDSAASDRMLSDMIARFPHELLISEFAAEEGAGSAKAEWIRSAYEAMRARPRIAGAVWFNMNKEADWRVESSSASLDAFRNAIAKP